MEMIIKLWDEDNKRFVKEHKNVCGSLYTGQKDINNKMLFEHDIIATTEETMSKGDLEIEGVIIWEECSSAFYIDFPQYGMSRPMMDFIGNMEKIGNEFLTPDYFEKKYKEIF